MAAIRLIPRLDIKGPNLIKGINLEGLRVIGDPHRYAVKYYNQGADELLYMDCVASLYDRNNLVEIIHKTAIDVFIPLTVGGGIRSVEDVHNILRAGADKVAVNTAAIKRPELLSEIANRFGSQCLVLSVEAKRKGSDKWEAYTNNGREPTGRDVKEWVYEGVRLGAGEVLITSVDNEGTRKGFDLDLFNSAAAGLSVPVIASGGMGEIQHIQDLLNSDKVEAIAMADILHYNRIQLSALQKDLYYNGVNVRNTA